MKGFPSVVFSGSRPGTNRSARIHARARCAHSGATRSGAARLC